MTTHISPSRKQSQPDSLRQAFQNLSVDTYLKRQRSGFHLSATAAKSSTDISSSTETTVSPTKSFTLNNKNNNNRRCNYLTVHSTPPPLTLKPSQSSPTATSPGLNKSYKSSPLGSPRTPTSQRQVVEQPYSPYYDSGFNLSSSSIASSCYSSSLSSLKQTSSSSTTASNSSVVEEDEDDELSMPSTPPPPASPCPWIKQDEEKRRMDNEEQHDANNTLDVDDDRRPNEKSERRDAYGFKQPTQWVRLADQIQFELDYQPILERQNAKWQSLLDENQGEWPAVNSKLKRYVRKGIPHNLRGKAWMHYSGAKAKMEANAGLYDSLVKTAEAMGEHNEYAEIINRDLHRTFPDNDQFACGVTAEDGTVTMDPESNPKLRALRRILLAFSVYAPHIGYCQSLNYLAGFFLLFIEDGEEAAFWMLITTVYDYFPENMYDVTMEGAHIDQTVLMMMVYERLPGVWNKIGNGKCFWECVESEGLPSITLVTSHWFLTLFINILPVETVLRVWDSLYIEGSKVLFRVALTIIKMNEKRIWSLDDPIEIFPVLQSMPRRLVNCHRFMECVFSKTGVGADISTAEIERRRVLFRDRRKQQRVAATVAAQAASAATTTTSASSSSSPASSSSSSGSSPTSTLSFRFFRR